MLHQIRNTTKKTHRREINVNYSKTIKTCKIKEKVEFKTILFSMKNNYLSHFMKFVYTSKWHRCR